jgi:hypothetical protein
MKQKPTLRPFGRPIIRTDAGQFVLVGLRFVPCATERRSFGNRRSAFSERKKVRAA